MDYAQENHMRLEWSDEEKIGFLRYCANKYETDGTSPISDAEYDKYFYELEEKYPDHEFFSEVGGIDDEHVYGTQIKHEVIMGSLSKCPDIDSFDSWIHSNYNLTPELSFVLQHKVDGLSLSLLYRDGKLVRAATRGNGTVGIDVTENAKFVTGVRSTIACKDEVEVRGECYKDKTDFYAKWHNSVKEGGYKNPRNFTAGSLNQKDATVTRERGLLFIAYEVVRRDFDTEMDKLAFLERNGFRTLRSSTKRTKVGISSLDNIVQAVRVYMDAIDRAHLPYDIDGIVVKLNDCAAAKSMGSVANGRKPKAHRAVKFPPEEKETKLIDVIPQVGRTGAIVPIGILEPIDLSGSVVRKVSLHNYGALIGRDDAIGSSVIVAKMGDIIPQIVREKSKGNKPAPIPDKCPGCKSDLEWTTDSNGKKVHLVCKNPTCYSQLTGRIEHWMKIIGVKGIGKGILRRLTDEEELSWEGDPIISSLPEIYYMLDNDRRSEHPFRKYAYLRENFGEKAFENIVNSIQAVNEVSLDTFITALGIARVGTSAKDIVAIAPTIEAIDALTIADLEGLEGFGSIKAEGFVKGWKAVRGEIKQLLKYVSIVESDQASDKLVGKKFCFTGSFSKGRKEMQAIVSSHGGKAVNSVGKDVILVWDQAEQGSKYNKAVASGNKIITEEEFLKRIEE